MVSGHPRQGHNDGSTRRVREMIDFVITRWISDIRQRNRNGTPDIRLKLWYINFRRELNSKKNTKRLKISMTKGIVNYVKVKLNFLFMDFRKKRLQVGYDETLCTQY